jgi:hypothetical protein
MRNISFWLLFLVGLNFYAEQSLADSSLVPCRWAGTSPFCSGHCGKNEVEIRRFGKTFSKIVLEGYFPPGQYPDYGEVCATGSKALCCPRCQAGLVWRQAPPFPYDMRCVTPHERAELGGPMPWPK